MWAHDAASPDSDGTNKWRGPQWIDRLKNFFQRMAQAVENSEHSCLVVSLLATEPEKMNDAIGKAVLNACNQGLNRQASVQSPVEKGDLAELLRRRMFEKFPENPADRHPYVTAFWDRMKAIDPAQAKLPNAEERLKDAYPFHPDLLARFFGKWTELNQFQRTRGVLQTFAAALREAEKWDTSPLIGPQVFLARAGQRRFKPGAAKAGGSGEGFATGEESAMAVESENGTTPRGGCAEGARRNIDGTRTGSRVRGDLHLFAADRRAGGSRRFALAGRANVRFAGGVEQRTDRRGPSRPGIWKKPRRPSRRRTCRSSGGWDQSRT